MQRLILVFTFVMFACLSSFGKGKQYIPKYKVGECLAPITPDPTSQVSQVLITDIQDGVYLVILITKTGEYALSGGKVQAVDMAPLKKVKCEGL